MICFPNAKINLGLHITSKRPDGYHNLETVFYPIGWKDVLEVILSSSDQPFRLFTKGLEIQGSVENNLIIKAYRLLANEKEIPPIDIHFLKKIPFGAGLGGGSSDAAFMLKLLNDAFELQYTDAELEKRAAMLGADCAFFVRNQPAFACGIGNILTDMAIDLSAYTLAVVKPPVTVSTQEAYALVTPQQPQQSLLEIISQPVSEWREILKNDFEPSVFAKYPEIRAIKEKLYHHGAIYASMSGSGSSVFGIFEHEIDLPSLFGDCFTWTSFSS